MEYLKFPRQRKSLCLPYYNIVEKSLDVRFQLQNIKREVVLVKNTESQMSFVNYESAELIFCTGNAGSFRLPVCKFSPFRKG